MSESYILKVLIWLLSPVAAESLKYPPPLVSSDPREVDDFFSEIQSDYNKLPLDDPNKIELGEIISRREGLTGWAYYQCCELMRRNYNLLEEITATLTSGAATVGDCIAVIEVSERLSPTPIGSKLTVTLASV